MEAVASDAQPCHCKARGGGTEHQHRFNLKIAFDFASICKFLHYTFLFCSPFVLLTGHVLTSEMCHFKRICSEAFFKK